MKRLLAIILTCIFMLSVTGVVLAAPSNPFVDVPAGHWSYDAVAKLADAGIVEGYGDNTYRGEKTITRYEMAQMVAKAMARSDKANAELKGLIDKLAVEYADELQNLGVRISKLEDKTKISWTFESRIRWYGDDNKTYKGSDSFDWRQRIYLNGAVNDAVSYFARLETTTGNIKFGTSDTQAIGFNRAGFNVKNFLGSFDTLTVGRFGTTGWTPGLLQSRTGNNDGVAVTKNFGDVAFRAATYDLDVQSQVNFASLGFKPADNLKLNVAYQTMNIDGPTTVKWPKNAYSSDLKTKSFDVSAAWNLGGVKLTGEYVNTKEITANDKGDKAFAVQITNGVSDNFYPVSNLVDPKKPHTDAFSLSYRSIDNNATPFASGFNPSWNKFNALSTGSGSSTMAVDNNVKGYFFAYQNVVSKNVIWSIEYQDLKSKSINAATGSEYKDKLWNTSFQFYF